MAGVKSSIDRCLEILDLLADAARPVPLGTVSGSIGLPKSAAHRLLAGLVTAGWVRQEPATGFYGLTWHLTRTGLRYLHRTGLPDLYQPPLEALAVATEAFARIALVEGDRLTWIGHAQGCRSGLIYQPELTTDVRLNVTANGKAWLASLPDEEALRLVLRQGIGGPDRYGPKARTRIDDLLADLVLTRERGWAVAHEEAEAGVTAIAAAIRLADPPAQVVGTVSIAGPVVRLTEMRWPALAEAVLATSAQLGALWPLRSSQPAARPPPAVALGSDLARVQA